MALHDCRVLRPLSTGHDRARCPGRLGCTFGLQSPHSPQSTCRRSYPSQNTQQSPPGGSRLPTPIYHPSRFHDHVFFFFLSSMPNLILCGHASLTRTVGGTPSKTSTPHTCHVSSAGFPCQGSAGSLQICTPRPFHTVFDWICLGVFTGSRSGEYAQTTAPKGSFAKVPDSWAPPPKWCNQPLAFMLSDFTLLDEHLCVIPPHEALQNPKRCSWIQIRYRFNKSATNFSLWRYRRGKGFLCPVPAAFSIIRRATVLQVPSNEPLGVCRSSPLGSYTYLRSSEIITVMQKAVQAVYSDPNHHYRINIKAVVAHSNRVMVKAGQFHSCFVMSHGRQPTPNNNRC